MNIMYPKVTIEEMKGIEKRAEQSKPKDDSSQKKFFCAFIVIFSNLLFIVCMFCAFIFASIKVIMIIACIFLGLFVLCSNMSILANGFKKEPTTTIVENLYDKLYPQKKQQDIAYKKLIFQIQRCSELLKVLTCMQEQPCEVKQLSSDTLMIQFKDGTDTMHISPDVCRCEGQNLDFTVMDNLLAKLGGF